MRDTSSTIRSSIFDCLLQSRSSKRRSEESVQHRRSKAWDTASCAQDGNKPKPVRCFQSSHDAGKPRSLGSSLSPSGLNSAASGSLGHRAAAGSRPARHGAQVLTDPPAHNPQTTADAAAPARSTVDPTLPAHQFYATPAHPTSKPAAISTTQAPETLPKPSTNISGTLSLPPGTTPAAPSAQQHPPPGATPCPASLPIHHFPLQQKAFDYIDQHPQGASLRVFAQECSTTGRRTFLVASPQAFWQHYMHSCQHPRHFYEIIRQASPCHLYFDLEFMRACNRGLDGNTLVDLLLELLEQQLQACFGLRLQPGWVLELDSSTPAKFSRHLHVRIPWHAFEDNFHVGAFVRRLCALALEGRDVAGAMVSGGAQVQGEQQGQQGQQPQAVQGHQAQQRAAADVLASAEQHEQQSEQPRSQSQNLEQQVQQAQVEDHLAAAVPRHAATSHQPVSLPHVDLPASSAEPCVVGAEGPSGSRVTGPDSGGLQQGPTAADGPGAAPAAASSSGGRYSSFVVNKENGQKTLFIDTGVYTRNRAFRLYLSSKYGKAALLRPSARLAAQGQPPISRDLFYASLITHCPGLLGQDGRVGGAARTVVGTAVGAAGGSGPPSPTAGAEPEVLATAGEAAAAQEAAGGGQQGSMGPPCGAGDAMGAAGPVAAPGEGAAERVQALPAAGSPSSAAGTASAAVTKQAAPHRWRACSAARFHDVLLLTMYPESEAGQHQGITTLEQLRAGGSTSCSAPGPGPGPARPRTGSSAPVQGASPFPQLDAFVESVCCQGGVQGRVRSWLALQEAGTIVYNIKDNRWCARISGPHKSNGIYLVVDVRGGTWCQKCYDPDCRGWRSEAMPLPAGVWASCRPKEQQPASLPRSTHSGQELAGQPTAAGAPGDQQQAWQQMEPPQQAQVQQQAQQQDTGKQEQQHAGCAMQCADDDDDEYYLQLLDQLDAQRAQGG